MVKKLPQDFGFDDHEDEVLYTRATLAADPNAADLLFMTYLWLGSVDTARALGREGRKATLEALVGEPIRLFAYPNGKPEQDYDMAARGIVASAGFDAAVTTSPGVATASSDPWQMPRFTPWERGRMKFALRLARNLTARAVGGATPAQVSE